MNNFDKRLYAALRFFADNSRAKVTTILEEDKKTYEESIPEDVGVYLSERGYIDSQGASRYIITREGLGELRELEKVKNRDITLLVSIIALIISLYNLAVTQGWIK